ncbi:MAG: UvrD-helicase domain-containing protein [Acidobacteriota bacterium]
MLRKVATVSDGGKTLRGPWPERRSGSPSEPARKPAKAAQSALALSSETLVDQDARERVRSSLDESLLVEAAAGTGKTTELIRRLVGVLGTGRASIDEVVAVTFTRKAAGELKLRLRQELDRARGTAEDAETRGNLEHAVAHLEEARIGTIHSFCAEILRRHPVAAQVDPSFVELSEEEAPALHRVAFERWIQQRLESPSEGLRRALVHLAVNPSFGRESVLDKLRMASWTLADWRDFPAPWTRPEYDRSKLLHRAREGVQRLAAWARASGNRQDPLRRALEPAITLDTWLRRRGSWAPPEELAGDETPLFGRSPEFSDATDAQDELEARLLGLGSALKRGYPKKGRGRYAEGVAREQLWDARARLLEDLEELQRLAQADLAATVKDELDGVLSEYEALKRGRGSVDYADLLLRARDLVREDARVREELQRSFSHLFVDEFQDTDPLQAELLLLLCCEDPQCADWRKARPRPGKLFVVGDPKQSIYRFRRADLGLYADVKAVLQKAGVETIHLTTSFRATAAIQRLVNAAFEPVMDGDVGAGSPDYVPLDPVREAPVDQPSVVVLPAPRPYGYRNIAKAKIEAWQPAATAAYIDWMLRESGWTVEDPDERGVRIPVQAEHVCLLFRRFVSWGQEITRQYTRELEARGIAHLLVGARTLHEREEVETLRSVLQAVEWPDDELALYASLRGSLFAFTDEALLRFRDACGRLDAFRLRRHREALESAGLLAGELLEVVQVLELVLKLHRRRNHRPIVETVRELLRETRAHAGFAMRPAGNQVLANVERVLDLARAYELRGGRSFRGFVERLEGESERPRSSQPAVVEDGAPGVRLMTVHNAKGLEFPVVLLADMTANLASRRPDRTLDPAAGLCASRILGWTPQELLDREEAEHRRDETEGLRVAYVAATRARDLLVVPAVGDQELDGWLGPLNRGIYPVGNARRQSEQAHGCPEMGHRSVLERPPEMEDGIESSVRPGLHRFGGKAQYDVVWWDPSLLDLAVKPRFGLRQQEILSEDEGAVEVERNLTRYRDWLEERERVQQAGARPSVDLVRVVDLEVSPPKPQTVRWASTERNLERPSGLRFGSLVHVLLQHADASSDLGLLARQHGRLLESSIEEIDAAVAAVEAARRHELVADAESSARVCREMPFTLPLGGEDESSPRVLEGTIDLAYLDSDGDNWVVVDFKTDHEVPEREAYERQVAWYCHALKELTGRNATGILLLV